MTLLWVDEFYIHIVWFRLFEIQSTVSATSKLVTIGEGAWKSHPTTLWVLMPIYPLEWRHYRRRRPSERNVKTWNRKWNERMKEDDTEREKSIINGTKTQTREKTTREWRNFVKRFFNLESSETSWRYFIIFQLRWCLSSIVGSVAN